jgi:hypothetical protein
MTRQSKKAVYDRGLKRLQKILSTARQCFDTRNETTPRGGGARFFFGPRSRSFLACCHLQIVGCRANAMMRGSRASNVGLILDCVQTSVPKIQISACRTINVLFVNPRRSCSSVDPIRFTPTRRVSFSHRHTDKGLPTPNAFCRRCSLLLAFFLSGDLWVNGNQVIFGPV